jgi:hypothetical protein
MNHKRYKPTKDGEFLVWGENIYTRCDTNQVLWGINKDDVVTLGTLVGNARTAYTNNSNREFKNHRTASYKAACFKALSDFLAAFTNVLEGTLTVPDADIVSMNLRPRENHAHLPKPVPTKAPFLTVINTEAAEIRASVSVEQHGHPVSSLGDLGYGGFVFRYQIEGETEWHEVTSTSLSTTVKFGENQRSKRLTCVASWVNPRLERGPHSTEVKLIIS